MKYCNQYANVIWDEILEFDGSDGKRKKILKTYFKDKNVGKIKKMRTMKIVDLKACFCTDTYQKVLKLW